MVAIFIAHLMFPMGLVEGCFPSSLSLSLSSLAFLSSRTRCVLQLIS